MPLQSFCRVFLFQLIRITQSIQDQCSLTFQDVPLLCLSLLDVYLIRRSLCRAPPSLCLAPVGHIKESNHPEAVFDASVPVESLSYNHTMPDRRHHLTDRVMKTKDDACHRLWPQSRRQVWWPSLMHTLWPPLPPPRGVSLLSVALLICSLAPFLSAEPVITSPSLPFPCENCQNASMSNVTQNYPSLANLIGPLFSFPLNNTSQFVHKSFNRLWRPKRSILFGRKRTQNGHPSGRSLAGNHTGPPPHYLEQTAANPNYWIPDRYHENAVCLLASFSGIVRIRPSNSSFRGGTFRVSPEDSLGRRSNCERSSRNMFWKFSQYDEKEVVNEEEDDYDINLDDETPPPKKADLPAVVGSSSRSKSSSKSSRMVQVERSNRLLSAGFHVVGSVIEFHGKQTSFLQPNA